MIIKTNIGNFGSYKDLYLFMFEELINDVKIIATQTMGLEFPYNLNLHRDDILCIFQEVK